MATEDNQDANTPNESLLEKLLKAQKLVDDDESLDPIPPPQATTTTTTKEKDEEQQQHPSSKAITILSQLQNDIVHLSIFSTNESFDEIQTSYLSLLTIEFYLAKAFLQVPNPNLNSNNNNNNNNTYDNNDNNDNNSDRPRMNNSPSMYRQYQVKKAMEFFSLYLERCDAIEGLLTDTITKDYRSTLEDDESSSSAPTTKTTKTSSSSSTSSRDIKIARYRETQKMKQMTSQLQALLQRRQRQQLATHEELDGHDEETLRRSLITAQINVYAMTALEELTSCLRELEMLNMAVQMEQTRFEQERYQSGGNGGTDARRGHSTSTQQPYNQQQRNQLSQQQQQQQLINNPNRPPMELTKVTTDPTSGQLLFRKQQIQSQVFRPHWNQPTMTLDELADIEVRGALERQEQQRIAEEEAMDKPRRYKELERDGREDDDKLVDASAALDRKWDDWKDENPRGSGNKMGDVGDRNF